MDEEFERRNNHIIGTEFFWLHANLRLAKLKGIPQKIFQLQLKKTKHCINHQKDIISTKFYPRCSERTFFVEPVISSDP